MKNGLTNNEKGSIILIALALLGILTMVGVVAVDNSTTDVEMSYNQMNEEQAFYVAEAGSVTAKKTLDKDRAWRVGYSGVSFGYGSFDVNIVDSSANAALFDTMQIVSTGTVNGAEATVTVEVVPSRTSIFKQAMFGEDLVDMKNSFSTDSYDSDSGSYAATRLDSLGDVGSNGVIDANNGTTVGGDVATSLSGGLAINPGATINGEQTDSAAVADLPPVPQSEFDWAEANNDNLSGISGTFSYNPSTHTFETDGTVVLSSGVYYFTDVVLKNAASLTLAPGASVTIYVEGDVELKNSAEMNATGQAADLLFLTSGDLKLSNSGEMHTAFYSPTGTIDMKNSGAFYGSVVGYDILAHNSAGFHYDRSLNRITRPASEGVDIVSWGEFY